MRNFFLIAFIVCAGVAVSSAQTSNKKKNKNYKGSERTLTRFYSLRSYEASLRPQNPAPGTEQLPAVPCQPGYPTHASGEFLPRQKS